MKFDAYKGDRGRVFDADGQEIPFPVHGDTETGIVVCQVRDTAGQIVVDWNGTTPKAMTTVRQFSSPLRIENL